MLSTKGPLIQTLLGLWGRFLLTFLKVTLSLDTPPQLETVAEHLADRVASFRILCKLGQFSRSSKGFIGVGWDLGWFYAGALVGSMIRTSFVYGFLKGFNGD